MTPISGYVYLIAGDYGRIKIGASEDPVLRLVNLQVGNPSKLEVLAAYGHARPFEVEQEVHRILFARRLMGEWFGVDPRTAMTAVMDALRNVDLPRPTPITPSSAADDLDEIKTGLQQTSYVTPPPPPNDNRIRGKVGYIRPLEGVPAAQQAQWMREAGVPPKNTYIEVMPVSRPELSTALRDCRNGDGLFLWSQHVLGHIADDIEAELCGKGAVVVYAMPQ